MSGEKDRQREERALDALIAAALRHEDPEADLDLDINQLPQLTAEEKATFQARGADFIQRLIAGKIARVNKGRPSPPQDRQAALTGAGAFGMNRGEDDEETKKELDERKRKILGEAGESGQKDEKEDEPRGD